MVLTSKSSGLLILRLIVGLVLLGCARVGSAAGTWSVISLPQKSGEVARPTALAVDAAGNLYEAEWDYLGNNGRIQKHDAQGHWSVLAPGGTALGQVYRPSGLAVDGAGDFYVADDAWDGRNYHYRIQKRDAQGNWSVIATTGTALGQVDFSYPGGALAVDAAGNLYVGDSYYSPPSGWFISWSRIYKGGSVIASEGAAVGQVANPQALAVDRAGNLYVADTGNNRVQVYTPGP